MSGYPLVMPACAASILLRRTSRLLPSRLLPTRLVANWLLPGLLLSAQSVFTGVARAEAPPSQEFWNYMVEFGDAQGELFDPADYAAIANLPTQLPPQDGPDQSLPAGPATPPTIAVPPALQEQLP